MTMSRLCRMTIVTLRWGEVMGSYCIPDTVVEIGDESRSSNKKFQVHCT